jgi:spermidine synthase
VKTARPAHAGPSLTPALRTFLLATATSTGAAVMIIEILGAKMLAPYFGTSHFVWTAQIGVTLLALAAGYAAGGWLADASPRLAWIYGGIAAAGAWSCVAVFAVEPAAYACLRFDLAVGSLLGALLLFFVPLGLLAMVSPFFARMLTRQVESVGRTVGRLIALSTVGSVIGTLLIGYVLIPLLPNSMTMYGCAAILLLLSALYFAVWERRGLAPVLVFGALAAFIGFLGAVRPIFAGQEGWKELYRANSNFGMLQVIENEGGDRRYYLNELLTQNSYDPQQRQSVSLFTHMLHGLGRAYHPEARDVLCIGMGVGIVPMQFAHEDARVDVVEINPAIVPVAERFFDFEPARVRLTIGDGRYFVDTTTNRYDVVVLDAFLGESSPSHLMTREAFGAMRRCMKPDGLLVINTIAELESGRDFLVASLVRTLGAVFRSLRVHASGNGNIFFVASDREALTLRATPDLNRVPWPVRGEVEQAFATWRTPNPEHGRVLTDDFNPVDYYEAASREQLRRTLALSYRPD